MSLLKVLIGKILEWLLEIPPDLLGRQVERFLDRNADRGHQVRRQNRRGHRRKRPSGRSML